MYLRTAGWLLLVEPFRAFLRNKVRSGLAMLGIISGVATVIWVVAIGRAGTDAALSALDSLGDNFVWIEAGSRNTAGVRTGTHGMTTLTPRDAEAIRREVPLITKVSENVDGRAQIVYSGGNWNTQWRGISPEYRDIRRWVIEKGEFITDDDVTNARTVVVIGDTVRRRLFGDDDPIGERVRIGSSAYTIVGTLVPKGASASGSDQDDTIMVPWTTAMRRLVGRNQTWLDDILCSAMSTETIRDAGEQASALLRERHRISLGADDDFNIRHPEELLNAKIELARRVSRLLALLALLSLAIGGIGIMNVMLASVAQRTTEIGLRMAIGATPAAVRLQFLGEATLLTTIAGGAGVVLGICAGPYIGETLGWRLEMSATTDVLALGFAAAVGVCFGMYPAIRASRMDPITALRVE